MGVNAKKPEDLTSTIVLQRIREVVSRHPANISLNIDSLTLFFALRPEELLPLLKELADSGAISLHAPNSPKTSRSLGTVTLLN